MWAEALVTKDPKVKASKRKYNRTSRFFKWQIVRVRSEHIANVGEKLESYPSRIHQFWALSKAALGNFSQPSRCFSQPAWHYAQEMTP